MLVYVMFAGLALSPITVAGFHAPTQEGQQTPPTSSAQPTAGESSADTRPGTGPGHVGGMSGGAYRVGHGVTPPKTLYAPDPAYTDQARHAQLQGVVVLWLIVNTDGTAHGIRVQRSLGMGLDEQAIAAVQQWKFQPATRNGEPVRVMINVEVNFRLFQLLPHPDSARHPPRFPGVAAKNYPLVVQLMDGGFRLNGTATSLTYHAIIRDAGQEQTLTIACTLGAADCLDLQNGTYPARWQDSGLELMGVRGSDGKWTKTEYAVERKTP